VLAEIGARVAAAVRPADTAARFGGDEFVVCCDRLSADRAAAVQEVEALAHRVIDSVAQPLRVGDEDVIVTASIGAALTADSSTTPTELIRRADRAMYEAKAKANGRGHVLVASDDRTSA
jgi:diguanylate cyclase (GGDEF)-like protein